jgi:hypothetical protein
MGLTPCRCLGNLQPCLWRGATCFSLEIPLCHQLEPVPANDVLSARLGAYSPAENLQRLPSSHHCARAKPLSSDGLGSPMESPREIGRVVPFGHAGSSAQAKRIMSLPPRLSRTPHPHTPRLTSGWSAPSRTLGTGGSIGPTHLNVPAERTATLSPRASGNVCSRLLRSEASIASLTVRRQAPGTFDLIRATAG